MSVKTPQIFRPFRPNILFLRPSKLQKIEEDAPSMFPSIETMVEAQKQNEEIGYTIDGFHYTALEGEKKAWEIIANQAVLYEKSRVVLAKNAKIKMFDSSEKVTDIVGDQAYYKMGQKDLEMIGNVKVIFPDGFWITTDKANYTGVNDSIVSQEKFYGETISEKNEIMKIEGVGFRASKSSPIVNILSNAHGWMKKIGQQEVTEVRSDTATIDRKEKTADFRMDAREIQDNKFVESTQGTMFVKSRRQFASYDSNTTTLKYLTAYEDVYIKELDPEKIKDGLKYATCQKADFITQKDKVILTGFPSAYQGNDILTGEVITVYRSENLIEVNQANAFHPQRQRR